MIESNDIFNEKSLNIFTCGASKKIINEYGESEYIGCSGVSIVGGRQIIDESYIINRNSTNINSEIKSIRNGILLAEKYRYNFPIIRLFSDAKTSIEGIRGYIFNWRLIDNIFYNKESTPASNQDIFCETLYEILSKNLSVTFFYLKGKTNYLDNYELENSKNVFRSENNIKEEVDIQLIRDLSNFNNMTKEKSKSVLKNPYKYCGKIAEEFGTEPIKFFASPFDKSKYFLLTQRFNL